MLKATNQSRTSGNKCYGANGVGQTYYTPCMHSKDTINNVLGVWYNYTMATGGTIGILPGEAGSDSEATESICPSGWKLPSNPEAMAMASELGSNFAIFKPVFGGRYYNKTLAETDRGQWWTSTNYDGSSAIGIGRYNLSIIDGITNLYTGGYERVNNSYVRCIRSNS